jgi:hypothetical protein
MVMRIVPLLFVGALVLAPGIAVAQSAADTAGIRQAALDYIEGWYAGNGDRMARALHPALAKRIMNVDSTGPWIREQGATELIRGTRSGFGAGTPAERRLTEVTVLDIFQNAASARIDAGGWIDYLHLVKWQGRWVILNVLWEIRAAR